jgi:hypothetical protein
MTSVSNISTQVPPPPAQAVATSVTQLAATSQPNAAIPQVNPSRLLPDPLSGVVITQYFDNTGNVVSQVPTQAVVAYLQIGLTAEGFSKPSSQTTTA